jgi:hypothetical protein
MTTTSPIDPITTAIARHTTALDAGVHPDPADELCVNLLVAADEATLFNSTLHDLRQAVLTAATDAVDHPEEQLVREALGQLLIAAEGHDRAEVERLAGGVRAVAGWVCVAAH